MSVNVIAVSTGQVDRETMIAEENLGVFHHCAAGGLGWHREGLWRHESCIAAPKSVIGMALSAVRRNCPKRNASSLLFLTKEAFLTDDKVVKSGRTRLRFEKVGSCTVGVRGISKCFVRVTVARYD